MAGVCCSVRMHEDTNFNLLGSSWAPESKIWLPNFSSGLQGCLQLFRGWDQGDELPWATCPEVVGTGEHLCGTRGVERGLLDLTGVFTKSHHYFSGMTKAGDAWHPMAALREVPGTAVGHKGTFPGLMWFQGVLTLIGGLDVGHCGGLPGPHARSPTVLPHGTYSTARGGLNHAKSDCGTLEWGSRI